MGISGISGFTELDETGMLDDELEGILVLDKLEDETIGGLCEELEAVLDKELEVALVEELEIVLVEELEDMLVVEL